MKKRIGFIGLGAMGNPMASNYINAGYEVSVYDISKQNVEQLKLKSAIACKNPSEVAQKSDIVLCSLPNGAIVQETMTGKNGVFSGCRKGAVVIDLSSVSPVTSIQLSQKANELGISYLDVPVSGGVTGAKAGTLTLMVGGDREVFESVKPELECIGSNIFYIGENGSGDIMKIVNNLMLGANMAALAEAIVLGEKYGLNLETMINIINISSGRSYVSEAKCEKFIMNHKYEGGFAVALQYKDLNLALEAAKEVNMPLLMASTAAQIYELANTQNYGKMDISSLTDMWEKLTV